MGRCVLFSVTNVENYSLSKIRDFDTAGITFNEEFEKSGLMACKNCYRILVRKPTLSRNQARTHALHRISIVSTSPLYPCACITADACGHVSYKRVGHCVSNFPIFFSNDENTFYNSFWI